MSCFVDPKTYVGSKERMGMVNRYDCESCGAKTYVELLDTGTTPFLIACPECEDGQAVSCMYHLKPTEAYGQPPTKQIYFRPRDMDHFDRWVKWKGAKRHRDECLQHVKRGGLLRAERGWDAS